MAPDLPVNSRKVVYASMKIYVYIFFKLKISEH